MGLSGHYDGIPETVIYNVILKKGSVHPSIRLFCPSRTISQYTYSILSIFLYWPCSYVCITPGSANFDKKKKKKKKKRKLLAECLLNECPKLLCGLGIGHRRRQTIPMWNSSGGKGID